ncbi:ABC transporter permease [Cellulomonas phragmiteti]|uniref:Transport permease protein n=1 Tax=Cellulomonas phragmiteti TaxID=478780 RepID=A0ABQ4DHW6_9CELL|nr:ABC transporter permease [Cellulomonas phragmiteti]GIG38949.1 transport permease protein [Cellulomonas phragmiteti]
MTTTTGTTDPRTAPGARPTAPALPGLARLAWSRTTYEVVGFFRERDAVVFVFAYPILMLAIFAAAFGSDSEVLPGSGVYFPQYFLPGMVATGVMLSSFQNLAISIAAERDDGTLKRLRSTPLPPTAYFLGKTGQVLLTAGVQTALLLVVAAVVFDVPLPTDAGRWWTFAWVFALGTAAGAVCGVAYSSVPRSGRSASPVVIPVVLVLQFVSGVFFRFDELPTWMQQLASVFPLKWVAQGMRSVFLPDEARALEPAGTWQHGATAAVLAAWFVAALVVGVRTFRWRRRDDG